MGVNNNEKARQVQETNSSHKGAYSCYLAGGALTVLAAAVAIAFWSDGKNNGYVGGMGIVALFLAGIGIRAAMEGFRYYAGNRKLRAAFSGKRDRNYLICRVGITANIVILLFVSVTFIIGCL